MSDPETHQPAPEEESPDEAAPEEEERRSAGRYCWIYSNVDGLNVRRRPTRESESVGTISRGEPYWANCRSYDGGHYNSCGGGDRWVAIWFKRRWRYVARRCVSRYGP
jgi:hypothetical protein